MDDGHADAIKQALSSSTLRRLYDYWRNKWHGADLPGRQDIDPIDFSYALGDVTLVDVFYDPMRFRFRLDGTRHVEHFGFDMTGRFLDAFPEPGMRQAIYDNYRSIVESRRPQRYYRDLTADGRPFRYEALLLPLARDGKKIDMIIVAIAFQDA
ncbi:MAG TPA: PAS domain-containing protein [Dongiaceae bacterium]|nr:PAS domain-containing protein [Dongiaceae bacterium]